MPVPSPSAAPVHCQPLAQSCPCPGPLCQLNPGSTASRAPTVVPSLPQYRFLTTDMVRTRGGSHLRPRVRFSTPEQKEQAPATTTVPDLVPEEPQGFRRYQTRMGPRTPSLVPQRRSRRARPSKRARTSGPGESSSSRPELSPSTAAEERSSPHLSPASRIRRPLFVGTPIPGNVGLHARDFHGESFYDVPALTVNPRFRDSMRLIKHYSLLPFMTPRQFYYPRVVLQFYHSMTSRGASSPLEHRFTIDDRPGVLRAEDISAALGLPAEQANAGGYRDWPQPTQRDPYSSGGSSLLRCFWWTTCSGPACSRYSTTSIAGEPYSRPCTRSQRDSSSVPLSWS